MIQSAVSSRSVNSHDSPGPEARKPPFQFKWSSEDQQFPYLRDFKDIEGQNQFTNLFFSC